MSTDDRTRFNSIDLIVAVCVLLVGFSTLWVSMASGRIGDRRIRCLNNMRQLGLALINFSTSKNRFPASGTFRDAPALHGGDPARSSIYASLLDPGKLPDGGTTWLHSWVVDVLPYLDYQDLANSWDPTVPYWWPSETITGQSANLQISSTHLSVLRCPDAPIGTWGQGEQSYVVNGGFTRWPAIPVGWAGSPIDGQSRNGGIRQWTPPGRPWQESQAIGKKLGVMFLGTDSGDQPWDIRTTPADLSDGASATLLLAENTLVGSSVGNVYSGGRATNWACPLPNFVMFFGSDNVCASQRSPDECLGGQLTPLSVRRDGPGWARANRLGTYENINFGQKLTVEGSFPFANSGHPGGANFVFCDGSMRFLSETIDGTVYAKLITPAGGRLPGALRQGPFEGDLD